MRFMHSNAVLQTRPMGLEASFSPPPRKSAAVALLPTARASLDGLEVSDSTWDEWVDCEARCRARMAVAESATNAGIARR